jgi:outer membrane protein assembly factor BamB
VPAFDAASGFAFVGTSNPYSKTLEHDRTNAVVKIDLRDRSSAAFGTIVASYKGVVDQYSSDLHQLNSTPACAASDALGTPYPLDDPACGQLDLDFGSPPNVFTVGGRTVVGALQKAGIYHLIDAATMKGLWATKVGAPCQACNAAATAVADGAVAGVSAPGGNAFSLDAATGSVRWLTPLASGAHYQGTTLAGGVFYTSDNTGLLDVLNAANGTILTRRPMTADVGPPVAALTSAGIAVADHTVFVAASSGNPLTGQAGWIIAYRAPSP